MHPPTAFENDLLKEFTVIAELFGHKQPLEVEDVRALSPEKTKTLMEGIERCHRLCAKAEGDYNEHIGSALDSVNRHAYEMEDLFVPEEIGRLKGLPCKYCGMHCMMRDHEVPWGLVREEWNCVPPSGRLSIRWRWEKIAGLHYRKVDMEILRYNTHRGMKMGADWSKGLVGVGGLQFNIRGQVYKGTLDRAKYVIPGYYGFDKDYVTAINNGDAWP